MEKLNFNGRLVGPGEPPYFIAEIGANHNGDMGLCKKMINSAIECGADAVKFQSWSSKTLISKAEYERNTTYTDTNRHFGSLKEMVDKYQFTHEQHLEILAYCKTKGVEFMSSAFSPEEVDMLLEMNVPCIKLASMDVNHIPLLKYVGSKGCQVMLSTGMASMGEIETAVNTLREAGSGPIALFHCISIYPPEYKDIHLNNMKTLEQAFDVPVGFSDHTIGSAIPLAAVALGACIIEKHFTTDKDMDGWDHWISANPAEMTVICKDGMNVWKALGSTTRTVSEAEMEKRTKFRRSMVTTRAIKKGEILKAEDFDFLRPGTGVGPEELKYAIGRKAAQDLTDGAEVKWDDFA
ncbi:N-acetylneuraminate synthase family protein [Desulfovibrio gilichinskyi]|uniref:N-acetylneuraminate synthase n=1 Tax=Desulfovibrio gilichinskyi TaxID=1519643 RepID=A0A1X7EIC2_9BACT|nr:N-acetylneuraminate synthase family protein [Desulfovibrio gilichinskyi]SMF34005.1 N-acetylneuraminate synthase [Desulfovibrio gilichinskyi]